MDLKETNSGVGKRHPWEISRFIIINKILARYKVVVDDFLDIGSGDLFFAKKMGRLRNVDRGYAIDIALTQEYIDKIQNDPSLNITAFNSWEVADKEISKPVSAVFLMDVLEHIENDREFLQQLVSKHYFTKETVFCITVPAFNSLYCSHDRFLGHYRRYCNKGLRKLLEGAGLKVKSMGYFNGLLILPRFFRAAFELYLLKKKEERSRLKAWRYGKLLSQFVVGLLIADFYFMKSVRKIGVKLPGLSNYAVCSIR